MTHPHIELLKKYYSHIEKGEHSLALALCADTMTFQVPGKSPISGKYTRDTYTKVLTTYQVSIHDLMATDLHATALGSIVIERNGKKTEIRTVQVWRFENGKPIAGYDYPRDQYAFDAALTN